MPFLPKKKKNQRRLFPLKYYKWSEAVALLFIAILRFAHPQSRVGGLVKKKKKNISEDDLSISSRSCPKWPITENVIRNTYHSFDEYIVFDTAMEIGRDSNSLSETMELQMVPF